MKLYNIFKNKQQTDVSISPLLNDSFHQEVKHKSSKELLKKTIRTEVINFLLASLNKSDTNYLEIGVRNPVDNFNQIKSNAKYSVDPGIEFDENPVDFKMTSDVFFKKIRTGKILSKDVKFDVIFIDGLHLSEQVEKDIENSLGFIEENGFIVLHDCNPPSEFHARESYDYFLSPAEGHWNGTTWKAFFKFRQRKDYFSCCINTDWGVGVISKNKYLGKPTVIKNKFYEFYILDKNREESLNLIEFEEFKNLIV